jgi:hypothetical protein
MTGMPVWNAAPVPKTARWMRLQWRLVWAVPRPFLIAGEQEKPNAAVMNLAAVDRKLRDVEML